MEYDGERTYPESEWAVRRWDWFNGGRVVEPLSFCQFWRTVLVWAPIKWFLTPLRWMLPPLRRLWYWEPSISTPRIVQRVAQGTRYIVVVLAKGCWFALRLGARSLWRLTYPLRCAARPVGGAALAGAIKVGQPIEDSYQRHKIGIDRGLIAFFILLYGGFAVFLILMAFLASWFWTLVAAGAAAACAVVGFAGYGVAKSGAGALLWAAAVVVHHGICPPVRIMR